MLRRNQVYEWVVDSHVVGVCVDEDAVLFRKVRRPSAIFAELSDWVSRSELIRGPRIFLRSLISITHYELALLTVSQVTTRRLPVL